MTSLPARAVALLLAGLALTACGGASPSAEPTKTTQTLTDRGAQTQSATAAAAPASPETTRAYRENGGYFINVQDLQQAYIEAGGECQNGVLIEETSFSAGTIECDGDTKLDVFDLPDHIRYFQSLAVVNGKTLPANETVRWLQGMNWVVRDTPEMQDAVREAIGGKIVTFEVGPSVQ